MMQKSTKALEPFTTGSWTWTSTNTNALEESLSSKLILPLIVFTTDSGCSKISFCMKELKFP